MRQSMFNPVATMSYHSVLERGRRLFVSAASAAAMGTARTSRPRESLRTPHRTWDGSSSDCSKPGIARIFDHGEYSTSESWSTMEMWSTIANFVVTTTMLR